jgi:hypothetical protein
MASGSLEFPNINHAMTLVKIEAKGIAQRAKGVAHREKGIAHRAYRRIPPSAFSLQTSVLVLFCNNLAWRRRRRPSLLTWRIRRRQSIMESFHPSKGGFSTFFLAF